MDFDTFHPAELPRADQSKLMNGTVVPRPIAWVTTIGSAGVNLAPFSYFNVVSVDPCIVMFSVSVPMGARTGTMKDTLQNLDEVPEFVLHLVDRDLGDRMVTSGEELPRGENEMETAGLTAIGSTAVRPPRIAEAGIQMECRVSQMIEIGQVPYRMVLGEVVALHARKGIVNDRHHVDQDLHAPIARLGGLSLYSGTGDRFQLRSFV